MKIYMLTALSTDSETRERMSGLASYLESKGHNVNKSRITQTGKPDYDEQELSAYHKNMMNSIKQCDLMIVEISSRSSGVGYEIAVALNERKPILALFHGAAQEHSSLALKSNPSKYILVKRYEEGTLNPIVDEFVKSAKEKVDTKFILIISPEIDRYLEWASQERRQHKAQVVREAVENTMNKDKDYQTFLKEQGNL